MHKRTLARAGAAEDGKCASLRNRERDVLQHGRLAVAERHMVKDDVTRRAVRRGLGRVLLLRRAQDIAHAVKRHARLAHVRKHAAERAHRPRQGLVIADEGEKFAERHIAVHAFDDAADDDDHDLQARQQRAGGPVDREQAAEANPQAGKFLVLFAEAVRFEALAAEGTHNAHAGQVLLRAGRQVALGLVRRLKAAGDAPVEHTGRQTDDRDERQRHERQLHVHPEHDDEI